VTSEPFGSGGFGSPARSVTRSDTSNLADILERVLDKGIVVAGDIVVSLVDVELLTIKLRLLIASVDKAKEMGIDWWEHDRWLSSGASGDADRGPSELTSVANRLEQLESTVSHLASSLETAQRHR
jgi:hypothetical protein